MKFPASFLSPCVECGSTAYTSRFTIENDGMRGCTQCLSPQIAAQVKAGESWKYPKVYGESAEQAALKKAAFDKLADETKKANGYIGTFGETPAETAAKKAAKDKLAAMGLGGSVLQVKGPDGKWKVVATDVKVEGIPGWTTNEVSIITPGMPKTLTGEAFQKLLDKMKAPLGIDGEPLHFEPDPPPVLQPIPKCPDCGGIVIEGDPVVSLSGGVKLHRPCYEQRVEKFRFKRPVPRIKP